MENILVKKEKNNRTQITGSTGSIGFYACYRVKHLELKSLKS